MLHKPTDREKFLAALDDFANRVRQAFLLAIANIRSRITLAQIIQRLDRHDTEGVIRALGIEGSVFNPVLDEIDAAFAAGGGGANTELPTIRGAEGFPITITFDARAPAAEAWLKQHGVELVRGIVGDQVTMLRNVIARDVGAGANSRQIALDIVGEISKVTGNREGGLVGLTASQEQWAANYEAALRAGSLDALTYTLRDRRFDAAVRKAVAADEPVPNIDKMVAAYRNRALRYRGELVGRTEAHTALNAGRAEAMRQAIAAGHVRADQVVATWWAIMDGRERDSHAAMIGQTQPFGRPFISGLGNRLAFPGDPSAPAEDRINCRCSTTFRVLKE